MPATTNSVYRSSRDQKQCVAKVCASNVPTLRGSEKKHDFSKMESSAQKLRVKKRLEKGCVLVGRGPANMLNPLLSISRALSPLLFALGFRVRGKRWHTWPAVHFPLEEKKESRCCCTEKMEGLSGLLQQKQQISTKVSEKEGVRKESKAHNPFRAQQKDEDRGHADIPARNNVSPLLVRRRIESASAVLSLRCARG